ncbi:hypothetical protein GCM10009663_07180 [Kitasatospora arboriphila]|uniref:Uncharacterized protein n=1 Tax=Kitasatospora arboriphila TaxID=258052 RepID=A0ABP4DWT7_9ACTN
MDEEERATDVALRGDVTPRGARRHPRRGRGESGARTGPGTGLVLWTDNQSHSNRASPEHHGASVHSFG